jgi:HEAT repeat protein
MMTATQSCRTAFFAGALWLCLSAGPARAQIYSLVQGLDKFDGSTAAWHLLETNGFVVTDPGFKQIFEPYFDDSLPVFITTDSAWHAYYVLLDEGMRQADLAQSRRLAAFSRLLWTSANDQAQSQGRDFSDLARFAAIGLALQDKTFRASLPDEQKSLAEALQTGQGEVRTDIGFPLWAAAFQAGIHESSSEWGGYLAAQQWYSTVVFRLSDARETRLALCLSWLINKEPDLLQAWKQLSELWDALPAPPEYGSAALYSEESAKLLGANFTLAALRKNAPALQSRLAQSLPTPRVNDQWLAPGDAARFGEVIKGFRLLPPRQAAGAVYFQNTSEPKIPGRIFSSVLDFFVASPSLRSSAAERALQAAEGGKVMEAVRKVEGGPLPDTLGGRALRLLATLQQPLPVRLGPALRSAAWADAQLWSQLGAWTEAEHTGGSYRAARSDDAATVKPSAGVVAPYPEFFAGLGKLALEAAAAMEKAGIDEPFDPKTAARKLLECILWQEGLGPRSQEESERLAEQMEQFKQFSRRFMEPHQAEIENNPPVAQKLMNDLETLARRCSTQTAPAEADRQVLLSFFQERQTPPKMMRDFAPVCDRLAELARKNLQGTALTEDDTKWIVDYGTTLARFQFYSGDAPAPPADDFTIVDRVQANPARKAILYAGLGRPQSLYVILPAEGRLRLYRGAVMTYRAFVRTNAAALDDESWRPVARTGDVPPPPAFTRSFYAARTAAELIKTFASFSADTQGYKEIAEVLEELQSRVTDHDLPQLIDTLGKTQKGLLDGPVADGIASAIAKLHWEPHQRELLAMLEEDDGAARTVAPILLRRPEGLDADFLSTNFDHAPARARRVYCALLSRLPQTDQTRKALLRALSDSAPAVRWEAATVVGAASGFAPQKTAPLLERLSDENEYVAAAAASALAQINQTNAAPALLANLEQRLQKKEASVDELRKQMEAVRDFALNPAEPGHLALNGQPMLNFRRMTPRARFAGGLAARLDEAPAVPALMEALGNLHYQPAEEPIFGLLDGPHAASAAKALKQLAPERLARRLVAEACDKQADAPARDRALALLATPPANGSATELIPLLDDTTIVPGIRPLQGREWRICDRAAEAISGILGRPVRMSPAQTIEQRDQQIEQIRQSVKAAY